METNNFKYDLQLLKSQLLLHQGRPEGDIYSSMQICEQILEYLQNTKLLLYNSQILLCIEQIDDNLKWLEGELVHTCYKEQSSPGNYSVTNTVPFSYGSMSNGSLNENLLYTSVTSVERLLESIP
ncbi:hypothetical protein QNI19_11035 [Cytophagaceae bacterium DM2B3-1]|uniref:Uncharacterized protein n=1 Tax=Xanthocytophaga flava TaxID=3048013 RepID=A0AAE3QK29_9BACT|nr:hypothetical protein [Xanthocytophaga flavus]MDJ1469521.1 hypothetical protein [Xanthocytophaga flavus]MDJ1480837.1 hypothetical protein [Xanthocytophaga flavus]MDJ1493467.1 hypothetical protein [Xanthocytophaga flavus]